MVGAHTFQAGCSRGPSIFNLRAIQTHRGFLPHNGCVPAGHVAPANHCPKQQSASNLGLRLCQHRVNFACRCGRCPDWNSEQPQVFNKRKGHQKVWGAHCPARAILKWCVSKHSGFRSQMMAFSLVPTGAFKKCIGQAAWLAPALCALCQPNG